MSNKFDLEKIRIILSKNTDEFKAQLKDNSHELFTYISEGNTDKVVDLIKEDDRLHDGNILLNILFLEPFSSEIINEFVKSKYLEDEDFYEKVLKVKIIASSLAESLNDRKKDIREYKIKNTGSIEQKLKELDDEIKAHQETLNKLEEKKKKEKRIEDLQNKIKCIKKELDVSGKKEMEEKLKNYEDQQQKIQSIEKEVQVSKEKFKLFPKDEA